MTKPDYEPVSKAKLEDLKDAFSIGTKSALVNGIRRLFDDPEGELVYLKKPDTLYLADRLEAHGGVWSRSYFVELLDSLTE